LRDKQICKVSPVHARALARYKTFTVLLQKIKKVEDDVFNLESENATLQMYIDNLTKQLARQ
jgi:short coiled-coil protein